MVHSEEPNPSASAGDARGFNPWTGNPLEKEMATHSNILAWKIPWTEEPRGIMGLQKSQTSLKTQYKIK